MRSSKGDDSLDEFGYDTGIVAGYVRGLRLGSAGTPVDSKIGLPQLTGVQQEANRLLNPRELRPMSSI